MDITTTKGTTVQPAEASPKEEQARYRQTFSAFLCEDTGWILGTTFFSAETIMPAFVLHLTTSKTIIGLLPAIYQGGLLFASLWATTHVERLRLVMPFLRRVFVMERLPIIAIGLAALLIGGAHKLALLAILLGCYLIHSTAGGAYWVAHPGLLTKLIPPHHRGRLFGGSQLISGLLGIGMAAFSRYLLHWMGFPNGFALCFLLGASIMLLCMIPLWRLKEPIAAYTHDQETTTRPLAEYLRILKEDRNYRLFVIAQCLGTVGWMGSTFYTPYAIEHFGVPDSSVAVFAAWGIGATTVGAMLWGTWADRRGNRVVILWATLFMICAPLIAIVAPSAGWYPLVYVSQGIARAGLWIAAYNFPMELAPPGRAPSYVAVGLISSTLFGMIAMPAAGRIVDHFHVYWPVFLLSSTLTTLSCLTTLRIKDPRVSAARHTDSAALEEGYARPL